jgi:hypothetical protein
MKYSLSFLACQTLRKVLRTSAVEELISLIKEHGDWVEVI